MSFLIPKKKKVVDEKEQEHRNKKYYDFGARISLKLGLPQKVKKANEFYAVHPKSVSFAIMGVCVAMFLLNVYSSHYMAKQEQEINSKYEYVSATPLISVMDRQLEDKRKSDEMALNRIKIQYLVDSLEKMDQLSPKDSAILIKGKEILNKLGGY